MICDLRVLGVLGFCVVRQNTTILGIMKIVKGVLVLMKAEKIGANLFMLKGETLYRRLMRVSHQMEKSQR